MPKYSFTITVPSTMSATVEVEAEDIMAAHDLALRPSFYQDPANAKFEPDEGNIPERAYLPDSDDYTEIAAAPKP